MSGYSEKKLISYDDSVKLAKKIIRQVLNDDVFACGGIPKMDAKMLKNGWTEKECSDAFGGLYEVFKIIVNKL